MLTGGCQCGGVRYEIGGDPIELYVCHCLECRKQSASAFGMSLKVRLADLRVTRGEPKVWTRDTDSGGRLACFFCPTCGSRLWHQPDPAGETATVKAGSVDGGVDMTGAMHIWTARRMPGFVIPEGVRQFPFDPE